ncbi:MAG: class 1 isoprenoid biosynthesis enzyme [Candidatus Diapherotrites archaeon]|nr:class 1 isoprenoid biosynthesis enzyme [Candidatus Diapherotrites archaeon]
MPSRTAKPIRGFRKKVAKTVTKAAFNRFLNFRERRVLLRLGTKPKVHYYLMLDIFQRFAREKGIKFKRKESAKALSLIYTWMRAFDDLAERLVRERKLKKFKQLKEDERTKQTITAFISLISRMPLKNKTKKQILKIFAETRRAVFREYLKEMELGYFASPDKVISWKENTTGKGFEALGKIMALLNDLSEEEAKLAGKALRNWSLAAQIADDMRDLHLDYGRNQNIFVSFLTRHPEEKEAVERGLRSKRVTIKWLEKRAPKTLNEVRALFYRYLDEIQVGSDAFDFLRELEKTFFESKVLMRFYR